MPFKEKILGNRRKTPLFARFLCQAQILILEILQVFLWLKLSPSLNSNKSIFQRFLCKQKNKPVKAYEIL